MTCAKCASDVWRRFPPPEEDAEEEEEDVELVSLDEIEEAMEEDD